LPVKWDCIETKVGRPGGSDQDGPIREIPSVVIFPEAWAVSDDSAGAPLDDFTTLHAEVLAILGKLRAAAERQAQTGTGEDATEGALRRYRMLSKVESSAKDVRAAERRRIGNAPAGVYGAELLLWEGTGAVDDQTAVKAIFAEHPELGELPMKAKAPSVRVKSLSSTLDLVEAAFGPRAAA
jgi:hypothetical protein